MRAAILLVLLSAAMMAQEQARPAEAPPTVQPPSVKPQGQIDPPGQCGWIAKDHPELAPVEKACETAVTASETLPSFVCDLRMVRKEPLKRPENITGELRFIDGEEELSDVKINGQPSNVKALEQGVLSRGEFSPPAFSVLDGRSSPQFIFRGEENTTGASVLLVFDYAIAKANNKAWVWTIPPFQYRPGFHGAIKIDRASGLVTHFTMVADDIDKFVPTLSSVITTDYSVIKIGDLGEYQLPVHSTVKSCGRYEPECVQIERSFVNCRKFAGKARIIE
jgi:hypothetical protein